MSPSYDTAPFLLHQICTSMCVQVGAFFLAIHSLVSIFIYGYVPAKLIFGTKNKAYPKLPIPFNDSLRISLYFLHFIYSLVATFDIKTTHSAVRCYRITIALRQLSHKVFVINNCFNMPRNNTLDINCMRKHVYEVAVTMNISSICQCFYPIIQRLLFSFISMRFWTKLLPTTISNS